MIGSHYSESGGGMYVEIGKCALGKYQEEEMTLLCRRHTLLRASWKMKQWDSLVCQKGWSFCNHFIFTWQRASYSLSPKDRSKRFSSYSPKGSSTGLLRPIWLVSSHFLLRTLCRPNLIYAHTALDTPDVVEAEVLSIFYAHLVLGHLIRCCHDPDCQSAGRKKKFSGSIAPQACQSSSFCHWEYSQKLSQHLPYLIPTSRVHLFHILMIGWMQQTPKVTVNQLRQFPQSQLLRCQGKQHKGSHRVAGKKAVALDKNRLEVCPWFYSTGKEALLICPFNKRLSTVGQRVT